VVANGECFRAIFQNGKVYIHISKYGVQAKKEQKVFWKMFKKNWLQKFVSKMEGKARRVFE